MLPRIDERGMRILAALDRVAGQHRSTPAAVSLAWLLAKPGITSPIVGASKAHHLEDAVAALSLKLTAEERALLEEPYIPHPVLGFS